DFEADLCILRPADPARANGGLLCEIPNRGGRGVVPFSMLSDEELEESVRRAQLAPNSPAQPVSGDGFLLERGWTIAWCGWQWDVMSGPGSIGLRAPEADVGPGWLRVEWRPDVAADDHPLSDSAFIFTFADYPTADVEDPAAVLT